MSRQKIGIGLFALTIASAFSLFNFDAAQSDDKAGRMYLNDITLESKRKLADFALDADVSKVIWKQAKWAEFDHSMSGKANYPEAATRVASVWTDKYIYFAFACKYEVLNVFEDEDISKERWELWNRDVAEVFLNPQPERLLHYYEFEVAPNNQWIDLEITRGEKPNHDAAWNSAFEHATHVDAANHVWTAEMRIPLSSMNITAVQPGTKWRANFFRAAGQGNDTHRKFLAWSIIPEGTTFHVPSRFGILHLVK
jgi:hypothetical protein